MRLLFCSLQFAELKSLGYKGFAVTFCGGKTQLIGPDAIIASFSSKVLDYLHALVVGGKFIGVA